MSYQKKVSIVPMLLIAISVVAIWLMSAFIVTGLFDNWSDRGTFGDMFGSVNALFAGLAFAGLIYTILLQRDELRLQRQELELTRNELAKSAEAQEESKDALTQQVTLLSQQCQVLQKTLERDEVTAHYDRTMNYTGQLTQYPSAFEFFGINSKDFQAHGVNAEQVAFLVKYLVHIEARNKHAGTSMKEHFDICPYCCNIFAQPITHAAWRFARLTASQPFVDEIDEYLYEHYNLSYEPHWSKVLVAGTPYKRLLQSTQKSARLSSSVRLRKNTTSKRA